MNTKEITAIVLRLLALWLLIQIILGAPGIAVLLFGFEDYRQTSIPESVYVSALAIYFLVGIFAAYLIFRASSSVINRATSESSTNVDRSSQKFLIQLAGVYFCVDALAYLPNTVSFIPHTVGLSWQPLMSAVGLLFQLLVGILLLTSTSWWARFLASLRG